MNHHKYAIITLHLLVDFLTLKNIAPPLSPDDIGAQLPPLPLLLNKMYQKLLSIRQLALILLTSLQPPYPNWYKPYLIYEHHVGIAGHNFHTCNAFKKNLIQLIKYELITFEEALDVNTNPLPNNALSSGSVNALEVDDPKSLKVSLDRFYEMLAKIGYKKATGHTGALQRLPGVIHPMSKVVFWLVALLTHYM
ncbi:hypothetical protein NC652_018859 [Populus alba x Populus x berolinensis]|nr:hypothetical protein NC652_018859 [Populus alba x Populus x berolinensis]